MCVLGGRGAILMWKKRAGDYSRVGKKIVIQCKVHAVVIGLIPKKGHFLYGNWK